MAYKVPVSSTKSMMGHLIAAAGRPDWSSACWRFATTSCLPTTNYETPDPDCDLDYVPNVAESSLRRGPDQSSFGFAARTSP